MQCIRTIKVYREAIIIYNVMYTLYTFVKLTSSLGQLGLGVDCDQHSPRKVQVPVESPPARACCGVDCSLVITESGQLLAAGNNRWGLLTFIGGFATLVCANNRLVHIRCVCV